MEAGLDDPEDVTPHLIESLAERAEAMDDPDYVGNPKGIMDRFDDESERTDLQLNLRRGKRDADRWHARHDGETSLSPSPWHHTCYPPLQKVNSCERTHAYLTVRPTTHFTSPSPNPIYS